ncbi:MAG: DNA mismatch repair endonuclease MutL [Eubacterium sp.]|jgi:DNA mismatch repair protein MutL|nr:DNA mismatch repair endonuclease MutL [Eubacterium sp.]
MPQIQVLDEQTIDKIAAGEVVERPSSVVKELVENAVDAKATAITIEIKDGGTSFIRITDNGQGIPKAQVPSAFLRHATSKLTSIEDLLTISSLGFRGEALSSIAAVAQVELITKTASELTGTRYVIEGSKEKSIEDIGAPEGTTFLVRNLFYNTPARQKFLKSAQTEAAYISTLAERLALSHPDISFQVIINNQPKLHTSGNTQIKDIIYHIFGRDIAGGVLAVSGKKELLSVNGFIGKPFISRGNRNFETYFINGRYIKSPLITRCIEDAYKPFLMKHQYPFTVLQISIDSEQIDVNVHPSKMEIRFQQSEKVYEQLTELISDALKQKDLIPEVSADKETAKKSGGQKPAKPLERRPEPFEANRLAAIAKAVAKDSPYERKYTHLSGNVQKYVPKPEAAGTARKNMLSLQPVTHKNQQPGADTAVNENQQPVSEISGSQQADSGKNTGPQPDSCAAAVDNQPSGTQMTIAEPEYYHADFIKEAKRRNYTIIGQLFDTYWLVQAEQELFIIDQHAAHEKVLYEKMMAQLAEHEFTSQQISPPVIITMTTQEQELFETYRELFEKAGFEVNPFGGREYSICAVPANLYSLNQKELFLEMLDGLAHDTGRHTPDIILEKIASMSCKAAVKGRQRLSRMEAEQLLADLLELENPYHCPHGRPTIIAMSRMELEKKFKRIV